MIIGSLAHPYAVEAARRMARRFGCLFIYEIRDIWPQSLVELGGISRLHPMFWHFRAMERRGFRHADGIISVLPGIAEYAALHGVPAAKVAYIPNGIDPNLYPEPPEPPPFDGCVHGKKTRTDTQGEDCAGEKKETKPFVISSFTRFGSGNSMETIIDAAALLHGNPKGENIILRLVGDGPMRAALQRRVVELGLKNVEFLNLVSKPELVELAHRSHGFVHAHRDMPVVAKYGMSVNKVFAFMGSGRPVIFSCRSCYDPIKNARAGISIEPENAAAMAAAMIELAEMSHAERADMGRRARDYVLEHHNLQKTAARLESFLQSLL